MKPVFLYFNDNELSLTYTKNESACIGETDATLEEFIEWMKADWTKRGLDISGIPKIRKENESKALNS